MNTQRQLTCTKSPPRGGPAAAAIPPTAAQIPIGMWRFSGGNSGSSNPSEAGINSAAPSPCTARAATRKGIDGASAQAAEAVTNTPVPSR